MTRLAILAAVLALICNPAYPIDLSGIKFDEQISFADQKLVLNGAGIRYRFTFQVYACGLYLTQKRTTLKDILALPGPQRVSVTMLRDISSDELGEALLSGIRKNSSPEETRKIGLQLVQLGQLFGTIPKLKKGDNFTLDYMPPSGTIISVNGSPVTEYLPDEAFFAALLRIWLGDNPVDDNLKPLLLGQQKEKTGTR